MSLGKWILGGLGWAVGGPIGAVIGVVIGSLFDTSKSILKQEERQYTSSNNKTTHGEGKADDIRYKLTYQ